MGELTLYGLPDGTGCGVFLARGEDGAHWNRFGD